MRPYLFILLFFVFIISEITKAQQFILLSHKGHPKQVEFHIGDYIHLQTIEDVQIKGIVNSISDSVLIINHMSVLPKQITHLYLERGLVSLLSNGLKKAGIGFFVIESFNNIYNGEPTIIARDELIVSGIFLGSGILIGFFKQRKCSLKKMWNLKIIDFNSIE